MKKEESEFHGKHVFLDFFMKTCVYCYRFQDSWNDLVDIMEKKYGDQVKFMVIDKDRASSLTRKYKVHAFPTFVYIKPETNAHTATTFNEDRDYSDMKKWMEKMVRMHGGKLLTHDFDEPTFEDDDD